ncbi:hypothetical protein BK138_34435 [Paenibacillus rhizosphaerae]|uniref:RAP domain-containing protein n=1 Tax=Paenibacillus rhizosphaerae TaxID=297318 RepID=A0A1R1DYU0_9BACL|nr:AAA domain-containing protein [Paenibacillus rhizosphaerae]OMF44741.1 hypothetical protein BK138_34435 [Paenibacillus rhizosphaerae]
MKDLLTLYRDRLTDLTARNKSLRLLQLTVKNHFDLARLDIHRIMSELMSLKGFIYLFPQNNIDEESILNNQHLTKLKREMDLIEQETGHNSFYIAYGFLEGELATDFYIRCPLLFYPAKLIRASYRNKPYWTIAISEEERPFINRAFLMATQKFLGADLGLNETEFDFPSDPNAALTWLHQWLDDCGLKVQFESELKLQAFPNLKRKDLENSSNKSLRLLPYAVMGKFQQSTSTLVNDYEDLLNDPPTEGFLHEVISGLSRSDLDQISEDILNVTPPSETFFVLETDASQEAAVLASRDKKGLIVHGPPGTGKSQVIVNMIVDRLAQDQRVLVVCQKKTALDVVYNRLGQIGLQGSVALVHDYSQNKADVYRKIISVMQETGPDYSSVERVSNEKQALAERLNIIAHSLHKSRPFGKTLHSLYNRALWKQDSLIQVEDLISGITHDELQAQLIDLRTIVELMEIYDAHSHPWSHRKSFAAYSMRERSAIEEITNSIIRDAELAGNLQHDIDLKYTPDQYARHYREFENLLGVLMKKYDRHIGRLTMLALASVNEKNSLSDICVGLRHELNKLNQQVSALAQLPEAETRLSMDDAKSRLNLITSFLADNQSILRFIKKGWHQKKKELIKYCESMGLSFTSETVSDHTKNLLSYIQHETLREMIKINPLLADSEPVHNHTTKWQEWVQQMEETHSFLMALAPIIDSFPGLIQLRQQDDIRKLFEDNTYKKELERTVDYAQAVDGILQNIVALGPYLREEVINKMIQQLGLGGPDISQYRSLQQSLNHFDSLCRLDQMKSEMGDLKTKLLERCQEKYPLQEKGAVAETWIRMIENSFYHAWILSIEEAEPHIKDVSTEIFERYRDRFKKLTKQKRDMNPLIVRKKLYDKTINVTGSVRMTLKHEAGKKRTQMPLRKVISHFQEPVFNLLPCWLCTPEAVSAIFPLAKNLFDLVIFDEASQCPVENAIPAIYRAKQLVVAGDEKQLPPSNFFNGTAEEENDEDESEVEGYVDHTDKEAKSLLEWSKPKFIDAWLTWHYRSLFGELISFSNAAFYNDYMQIAPAVTKRGTGKPIEFHQVEGRWENSVNRIEAERIVDLVFDLLQKDDHPTIGVIAFNQKQAALIGDLLEQAAYDDPVRQELLDREKERKNGEESIGLFVKNIENVQGDERDIILFSVTYAKDVNDRMVSNFGPLSIGGGENRLNVAISRARQKIHIVCSFDPTEWTRAETYAKGVRLFKRYLEYGKAISDGDEERAENILSSLLDGTRLQGEYSELQYDSVFEEQVAEALRKRNYEVHTQIGFSGYRIDLAIVDPNKDQYILGIECDGAMYHSSKVARERDMYRQRFLESKGWAIHRIWSRNWWLSREHELQKIDEIVTKLNRKTS